MTDQKPWGLPPDQVPPKQPGVGVWGWVRRHKIWSAVIAWLAIGLIASPFIGGDPSTDRAATDPSSGEAPIPVVTTAAPTSAPVTPTSAPSKLPASDPAPGTALALLDTLPVKGRAPKTGYSRDQYGQAWADTNRNGCDTRNDILRRDLRDLTVRPGTNGCVILSGTLNDPYTATVIQFVRGGASEVDIDHVVALSDSWQTGAQPWPARKRLAFANDPLNLLAVDASANRQKGDSNAASWLPSNKSYRCAYVARQVAVKAKYQLWVVAPEKAAIQGVLAGCPSMAPPSPGSAPTIAPISPGTTTPRTTAPEPPSSGGNDPDYGTCAEAKRNGKGPYYRGRDPEYDYYTDRDGDGVVCE
jgi:hypothetical protein